MIRRFLLFSFAMYFSFAPKTGADEDLHSAREEFAAKFLTTYLNTPYSNRGQYVLDPKAYEQLWESYYKNAPDPQKITSSVVIKSIKNGPKAGYCTITAEIRRSNNAQAPGDTAVYYGMNTPNGFKINWVASTGAHRVSYDAFIVGDEIADILRCTASLSRHYNYDFISAQETHYSIRLKEPGGGRALLHGYVEKQSALGRRLYSILEDGGEHNITVSVIKEKSKHSGCVKIIDLISETWLF